MEGVVGPKWQTGHYLPVRINDHGAQRDADVAFSQTLEIYVVFAGTYML